MVEQRYRVGRHKFEWAREHMKIISIIRGDFKKEKPLKGLKVGMAMHIEAKTAVLVETLMDGGAEVFLTGCNPLSTQDDIVDVIKDMGAVCFAKKRIGEQEYYGSLKKVALKCPDIIIDDGGDLIFIIHSMSEKSKVIGACEETTTGVIRLRAMERDKVLSFPVIAVNDAMTKHLFDNRYGTGQSAIDGVLRATNILLAGKTVVVAGYGWCGRGIAYRLSGMGANVIITEVDEIRALEAVMEGFRVMSMDEASKVGDLFITAAGNREVIREEHFMSMKDCVIITNSGHFNVEVDIQTLERIAMARKVRKDVVEYDIGGKKIYLLAEGRLVNLVAGDGHPIEIMDMSFSAQAFSVKYIAENHDKLDNKIYILPGELDRKIAELKLKSMGIKIDKLNPRQVEYLEEWRFGT